MTAQSSTAEFPVQILGVHGEGIATHTGECQQEVSPVHSGDLCSHFLRNPSLAVPQYRCSNAHLLRKPDRIAAGRRQRLIRSSSRDPTNRGRRCKNWIGNGDSCSSYTSWLTP